VQPRSVELSALALPLLTHLSLCSAALSPSELLSVLQLASTRPRRARPLFVSGSDLTLPRQKQLHHPTRRHALSWVGAGPTDSFSAVEQAAGQSPLPYRPWLASGTIASAL